MADFLWIHGFDSAKFVSILKGKMARTSIPLIALAWATQTSLAPLPGPAALASYEATVNLSETGPASLQKQYARVSVYGLDRIAITRHVDAQVVINGIKPVDVKMDTGARTSFLDVKFSEPFNCSAQEDGIDYTTEEYADKFVETSEMHKIFDEDEPDDDDKTLYVCDGTTSYQVRKEDGSLGPLTTSKVVDVSSIKPRANEERTIRPVVETEIRIDDLAFTTEVNLGERPTFNDRLIVAYEDIERQGFWVVTKEDLETIKSYQASLTP